MFGNQKTQKAFSKEEEEELQRHFKACKGLIGKDKVFKNVVRKID